MFSPDPYVVLAFDFGGTKLSSAVVEVRSGRILSVVRRPTPTLGEALASLEFIVQAGREAIMDAGSEFSEIQAIGISFGGPVSKDRRMVLRSMHVKAWDSINLPEKMANIFDAPAFMDNDANAAALGEWVFGAGKGAENLIYIQVSTGIGSGLIMQRQLYRGSGLAGEFGHTTMMVDGPQCTCGKRGCLETLASGWAIAREGRSLMNRAGSARLRELSQGDPEKITAELVLRAGQEGDPGARSLLEVAFQYLGLNIANVICMMDPDVVVIGGGLSNSQSLLWEILEPYINKYLPILFQKRVRITFAELKGQETLLGAALLTQGF